MGVCVLNHVFLRSEEYDCELQFKGMRSDRVTNPVQTLLRHGDKKILVFLSLLAVPTNIIAAPEHGAVQTIVFVRHGEKPDGGFGQLSCQGLNRALALAPNIANTFGKPIAIFAPNPSHPKMDAGTPYDYIRPLATIEPTAVLFGLPVDVSLDLYDKRGLVAALEKRRARDRDVFILVAWEHKEIAPTVRAILSSRGADAAAIEKVDDWDRNDFDSMYVVAITQLKDGTQATFEHKHEGLDGQPNTCPH
jgi:hypothetical protein